MALPSPMHFPVSSYGYEKTCGKEENTIEGYETACGFEEGAVSGYQFSCEKKTEGYKRNCGLEDDEPCGRLVITNDAIFQLHFHVPCFAVLMSRHPGSPLMLIGSMLITILDTVSCHLPFGIADRTDLILIAAILMGMIARFMDRFLCSETEVKLRKGISKQKRYLIEKRVKGKVAGSLLLHPYKQVDPPASFSAPWQIHEIDFRKKHLRIKFPAQVPMGR